ncbi:hypothetical protein PF010_g25021 [Phytophthora fragariae]|uniref:Secreted protein n=1 Tax=Phytophthora fragariae TaxID=53985 RepID=A0A6G0K118_9STRA|nr:hypothetical protein PF010_g25021 [Phytophthora fragariae]KAE9180560.1 hypothetical protein PF004_g24804 [Phytophthora fragariae]KAE9279966.1 hypothetical protein PF008_g28253 [Phytophthora fragariae]
MLWRWCSILLKHSFHLFGCSVCDHAYFHICAMVFYQFYQNRNFKAQESAALCMSTNSRCGSSINSTGLINSTHITKYYVQITELYDYYRIV